MSFKIFDVGIETFKTGKNSFETLIMERFINQLKKISEQIQEIVSDSESTIKFQNKDQAQLFYQQQTMFNQIRPQITLQIHKNPSTIEIYLSTKTRMEFLRKIPSITTYFSNIKLARNTAICHIG